MSFRRKFGSANYAVVAGMGLNGLGVLRALGKAGIPAVGLDTDTAQPSAATRFGHKIRIPALSGQPFIEALLALSGCFNSDAVLFLTQEESVATVSAARNLLDACYRISLPKHDVVRILLDKSRFQAMAERVGSPVPRIITLSDASGATVLDDLRFPCVLKPAKKNPRYSERFAKAYKVASVTEAWKLWSDMRATVDELIVQEWIEGTDSDVYFCLQYRPATGGLPVSFVGRKTCQWPPLVGGTASCIPAPEAAHELTAMADRFFGSADCAGLCSMEYKRDVRDGRFYLVEPTIGRTDYQEEIAALNGTNIPAAAYYSELGRTPPRPQMPARARGWRDPYGCANAEAAGAADRLRSLAPDAKVCDAYFRVNDPVPYIALKLRAAANACARISARSVSAYRSAFPRMPGRQTVK